MHQQTSIAQHISCVVMTNCETRVVKQSTSNQIYQTYLIKWNMNNDKVCEILFLSAGRRIVELENEDLVLFYVSSKVKCPCIL